MSVQSVFSASVPPDSGLARKRASGTDGGQASEPFALPERPDNAAPPAQAKSTDVTSVKTNEINPAQAKPGEATPVETTGATMPAPKAGTVSPIIVLPQSSGALPALAVQEVPSEAIPTQAGTVSILLAATIAAQAEAPVKPGADEASEAETMPVGEDVAAVVVDPNAIQLLAALVISDAKTVAPTPASDTPEAAAAVAALGGITPALAGGAPAIAIPGTDAAADNKPALDTAAAIPPAAAMGQTLTLPSGDDAQAKAGEAEAAPPAVGPGQAGIHPAKANAADKSSPVAAQDSAQKPEFKIPEALQPVQGAIDISAMAQAARPSGVDAAQAATTPDQGAQVANAQPQSGTGQPTPLHVVPIEIGLRALAGGRKFDIRLDPAELGRVDVSLDISDAGEVTAKLVVDRVETLHLLQRDARTLERAFEQAGLKPSNAGVEITLRDPGDQSFRQNRQQDEAPRRRSFLTDAGEDAVLAAQPVQSPSVRGLLRLGGVDLSI